MTEVEKTNQYSPTTENLAAALWELIEPYEGAWLGDDGDLSDPDGSIHAKKSPTSGAIRYASLLLDQLTQPQESTS